MIDCSGVDRGFALPARREGLIIKTKRSIFVIGDLVVGSGSCCAAV
jgi:hypothetical protein